MTTSSDHILKRLGEGWAIYRRRWVGDAPEMYLISSFLPGQYGEALEMLKRLSTRPASTMLQAELVRRIRCTTDPVRLDAMLEAVAGIEALDDPSTAYRSVNADIRPVPLEAIAALDDHLHEIDEEAA